MRVHYLFSFPLHMYRKSFSCYPKACPSPMRGAKQSGMRLDFRRDGSEGVTLVRNPCPATPATNTATAPELSATLKTTR